MSKDVGTTRRKAMSPTRRLRIWEAHSGQCVICGGAIDGVRDKWIIEHVRALALGGEDADTNCGPAHSACADTKTKGDMSRITKAKASKAKHLGIRTKSALSSTKPPKPPLTKTLPPRALFGERS